MMVVAYLPLIYFIWLFLNKRRKHREMNAGSIVVLFYIISAVFSVIYLHITDDKSFIKNGVDNILPTILYCSLLTIVILPVYSFKTETIKLIELRPDKKKVFVTISWILVILSLISIISFYGTIVQTLRGNLGDVRNLFYKSNMDFSGTRERQSLFRYFLGFGESLSPITLLFFFYGLIYNKENRLLNILLLVSSTTQALHSIINASRTQIVYWLMTAIVLYICFRPQMDNKARRIAKILGTILGVLAFVYFFAVTVSRFQTGSDFAVQNSLIRYIGLPYPEFCKLFNLYSFDGICLDRTFPIFCKYVLGHNFNLYQYRMGVSKRIGMNVGTFFSFLGDAMIDFGRIGMILYAILFSTIEKIAFKRSSDTVTLSQMILFLLLLRVPLLGIFAYVYLSISSSLTILGSLIIMFALSSRYRIVLYRRRH